VPPESAIEPDPAAEVIVPPPHEPVRPFGVATVSPPGSVSVNATPARATAFAAGFVIVKLSVEFVPGGTVAGLKALTIEGAPTTLTLAEAVPPVPPCVDVTFPVVLFCVPATMPVTLTENVHEPLGGNVATDKLTVLAACVAVIVPPPQLPVNPFGVEIANPAGRVSVKPTPPRGVVVLLFWIAKLSDVEPCTGMLAAPNVLTIVGGALTVMDALEVFPAPPAVEVTLTLLFFTPADDPLTVTDTVHEAPLAMVPPVKLTIDAPPTAVAVPPQVLLRFGEAATTRPAGRLSVNAMPVKGNAFIAGLPIVNDKLVDPFKGILAAPNAFRIDGGVATVRFAVAVLPVPPFVEVTLPVVFVY